MLSNRIRTNATTRTFGLSSCNVQYERQSRFLTDKIALEFPSILTPEADRPSHAPINRDIDEMQTLQFRFEIEKYCPISFDTRCTLCVCIYMYISFLCINILVTRRDENSSLILEAMLKKVITVNVELWTYLLKVCTDPFTLAVKVIHNELHRYGPWKSSSIYLVRIKYVCMFSRLSFIFIELVTHKFVRFSYLTHELSRKFC